MCAAFRNEGAGLASELIIDAVAATRAYYGNSPAIGMVTFIDTRYVTPTKVRGVDTWGYTYSKAGFREAGKTKGGLLAYQLLPERMPPPEMAIGMQEKIAMERD